MQDKAYKLPRNQATPMVVSYCPEMDVTPVLNAEEANYYQSLVGVLRWIIEIGWIDITTEVSMLAAHMAMPREGHLYAVFRVFAYLKGKHNVRLIFDHSYPPIHHEIIEEDHNWVPFYGKISKAIPPNAPQPRGIPVVLRTFVDSDHAGNLLTRRLQTGYIQMIDMLVILWRSKKQGSIECSTFGSKFVAAKSAMDVNCALRYKLRMMGIPIDGHTYMFCDNMSVVNNTTAKVSIEEEE
jgi:hypothetical protein